MQPYTYIPVPTDAPDTADLRAAKINNLLARSASMDDINTGELQELINISDPALSNQILNLYVRYFEWCLTDKKLTADERSELKKLKKLFLLNDKDAREAGEGIISNIYSEAVAQVLEDGVVTDEEKDFLSNLRNDLYLDEEIASGIMKRASENYLKNFLKGVLADERLTSEEEEQLFSLSENLNIELKIDAYTKGLLERYKIYWLIDNGDLPALEVDIDLEDDEICHFYLEDVRWYETDPGDADTPWNRITMRRKLNAAISNRFNNVDFLELTIDDYALTDAGKLYFTNKKIYFTGTSNFVLCEYENIRDFNLYRNGFEINLTSGAKYMFQFDENPDITGLLLNRLIFN